MSSNSQRIEQATRNHVGATLTSEQIVELIKISDPNWKGGVYPSDAAYKRVDGKLVPRGAVAYGDGVLEYLGANSFKVLASQDIVRRPTTRKAAPAVAASPTAVPDAPKEEKKAEKKRGKGSAKANHLPVAPKQKGALRQAS
jgi:hypothetical protein